MASADTVARATCRANYQIEQVLRRIKRLGLSVTAEKTEMVLFSGKHKIKEEEFPYIQVGGVEVKAKTSMKYLEVILDSKMSFSEHFRYIEVKAAKVAKALCRLMPNLRDPKEAKRRFYAEVLKSVILYGAPVWSDELQASCRSQRLLDRLIRNMALRVISAYRTVSLDAATLMARIPLLYSRLVGKEPTRG